MKKELIGILICTLLISVVALPATGTMNNINLEKQESQIIVNKQDQPLTLSEQDIAEIENKLIAFAEQISNAETWEEKESIFWEVTLFYDKYGFLPEEMTVEEAFELMVSDNQNLELLESQYDEHYRQCMTKDREIQVIEIPSYEAITESIQETEIIEPMTTLNFLGSYLSPIKIIGNENFTAENGVTGGSGTENDPYIIENWTISGNGSVESGILIKNTDAYFIIRNCTLAFFNKEFYSGIKLSNVVNGRIEYCEAIRNYHGINIVKSSDIDIANCYCREGWGWSASGIEVDKSHHINISSCRCNDMLYDVINALPTGISLDESSYCLIENCTTSNNYGVGIDIFSMEEEYPNIYNTIKDCKILNNRVYGIYIGLRIKFRFKNWGYHHITGCEINGSGSPEGSKGILISCLKNNIVENCDIHHTVGAVELQCCSNSIVRNCSIHENNNGALIWGWQTILAFAMNNKLEHCDICNSICGLDCEESINTNICNNNIYDNGLGIFAFTWFGITIVKVHKNNIYNNYHSDYEYGHFIRRSFCDARYNWWGSSLGPSRPWLPGRGDIIVTMAGICLYSPWEKEPIDDDTGIFYNENNLQCVLDVDQPSNQQSMISVNDETLTLSNQDTTFSEDLIDDIIERFYDAETQQEKIAILEELILILDEYGLLPGGMTVEEAKASIVSSYLEALSSDSLQDDMHSDIAGDRSIVVSKSIENLEKSTSGNTGSLIDNVEIRWLGTISFADIFLAMLGLPVYFTQAKIKNNNDVAFDFEMYITLSTGDGRVLDEYHYEPPIKHQAHGTHVLLIYTLHEWQWFNYLWGRFDITIDYHILDDNSSVKKIFHGFVYKVGSIIFNSNGEVIDEDDQNLQSSQQSMVSVNDETLTLSEQDLAELEKQLEEMTNKFYSAENRDEKIDIIKETVVLIDEYGQLPSGLSAEQVLQLLNEQCQDPEFIEFLDRSYETCIEVDKKDTDYLTVSSNNSDWILENLKIKFRGSYPMELLFAILFPNDLTYTVSGLVTNYYYEPITIDGYVTLIGKWENRVLDEFYDIFTHNNVNGGSVSTKYITNFDWRYYDYTFGPFDFIWDVNIPEVDASITLVFHGFVFYFGTVIFNPEGEIIDGQSGNHNIQIDPSSQQSITTYSCQTVQLFQQLVKTTILK